MKITDIKVQSHNKERASVFVDDEYSFSLDLTSVLKFSLKKGKEITEDEIERYNREGNFAKIRDKAMDILSKKAVTKKMLLETLIKKEYDKNLSKEVVDELIKIGCIDDLEFAKNYARDAFEYKKHGKMRITTDLLKKGVEKSDIDEAFLSLSFSYDDNILDIINTKFKNADFKDIKTKNKIIRYLAYRGYNISDIMSCLGKME
ncbi:MAG: regulatory protein RecX [Ruminococcaceae bacterium]|nr:regulatory protein RecX [Oscillospiraceae bacterium]